MHITEASHACRVAAVLAVAANELREVRRVEEDCLETSRRTLQQQHNPCLHVK